MWARHADEYGQYRFYLKSSGYNTQPLELLPLLLPRLRFQCLQLEQLPLLQHVRLPLASFFLESVHV